MKKFLLVMAALLFLNSAAFSSPAPFQSGYAGVIGEMSLSGRNNTVRPLSDYEPALAGTVYDTPVVVLGSENAKIPALLRQELMAMKLLVFWPGIGSQKTAPLKTADWFFCRGSTHLDCFELKIKKSHNV